MSQDNETAQFILNAVGGKDNVQEAFHCIARIRIYVKDKTKVDLNKLNNSDEIFEAEFEDDQLQILVGNEKVEKFFNEFMKEINDKKNFDKALRGDIKMSKSSDKDKQLAEQIVKLVGGKENVNSLIHCVTRLRFKLKDESKADDNAIKNLKGVMGVAHSSGQYQVIIGNNVANIYDQVMPLLGLSTKDSSSESDEKEGNWFSKVVTVISSLFMPLLGIMTAAGMLKGLLVLFTVLGWLKTTSGTYLILNAAGDAFFYFLPIVLGFTAAKTFHVNQFVGAITGAALVYPSIVAATTAHKMITFLGIPVHLITYSQSMLPVVFAVWAMSYLEKVTKRYIPSAVKNLFVPLIDIVIIVPLTFIIVGPVMQTVSQWLSTASLWIYGIAPIIAGFIIGGLWQAAVIVGLHWAFGTVCMNNLMTNRFDPLNGIMYCTIFGQIGAALAMGLKAKDKSFKEVALPSALSGFFGITEPIIYGVTLPHKKSFLFASIGSAFGGTIAAVCHAGAYTWPTGGVFALPAFINPKGINIQFIGLLLSVVVAFVISFVLTLIWGDVVVPSVDNTKSQVKKVEFKDEAIYSPVTGKVVALKNVKDDVFSTGTIGKGIAIQPDNGEIYAPFDGEIISVFPTKHAIGLKSKNGVELLIHIGIDTVNLKGKGFDSLVKAGDQVKKGQLIEKVDLDQIKQAGYDTIIPIIVTNSNNFDEIIPEEQEGKEIQFGDQLLMATVDQKVELSTNAVNA